jgi:hypothetical protein
LGSFHETEGTSILIGFSFGLGPSDVRYPLAQKPDDERILAFDFFGINGEELRDPVCHDLVELFSGHRLEAD